MACALCVASLLPSAAQAQDTAPAPAASQRGAPLISIPSTPTPSAAVSVAPAPAVSNAGPLTTNGTVNGTATLTGNRSVVGQPGVSTPDIDAQKSLDETLGGIVTNNTVTLAGMDFYRCFAQAWNQIPLSERYIVSIHERPSARYGSLIWVEFNQRQVFQAFLPIARSNVKAIAESASALAFQNVMQADIATLIFRDVDLASDEM